MENTWYDIELSNETIRELKKRGLVEKYTGYRMTEAGDEFVKGFFKKQLGSVAAGRRERESFTIHYMTDDGQSVSKQVAARDASAVMAAYPTWDTIQRDGELVVLD